jgi:hypothetical protein
MPAAAQTAVYKRNGFWSGYSDKEIEKGIWRVRGSANGFSGGARSARALAFYRASEIAKEAGFRYLRILNFKGEQLLIYGLPEGAGSVEILVRGAASQNDGSDCRAADPMLCRNIEIDALMDELRPQIRFPRDHKQTPDHSTKL